MHTQTTVMVHKWEGTNMCKLCMTVIARTKDLLLTTCTPTEIVTVRVIVQVTPKTQELQAWYIIRILLLSGNWQSLF